MGQAVNGEMKAARRATDLAIADLYKTIEAMNDLMPSAELTNLITQLKGIELYARQYIIKDGSNGTGTGGTGTGSNDNDNDNDNQGGTNQGGGTGTITPTNPDTPSDPGTGGGGSTGDGWEEG